MVGVLISISISICANRLDRSKRWVDTAITATPAVMEHTAMRRVLPFLAHHMASAVDCPAAHARILLTTVKAFMQ